MRKLLAAAFLALASCVPATAQEPATWFTGAWLVENGYTLTDNPDVYVYFYDLTLPVPDDRFCIPGEQLFERMEMNETIPLAEPVGLSIGDEPVFLLIVGEEDQTSEDGGYSEGWITSPSIGNGIVCLNSAVLGMRLGPQL